MRALIGWCLLGAVACQAGKPASSVTPTVSAPVTPPARSAEWSSSLDRDHYLVGKVYDVKANAFIEPSLFVPRLAAAQFVLLGEKHDNPDHHRLQGKVITELVASGRHPAVVLEMLEVQQQPDLERYLQGPNPTASGLGPALAWEKTSWPPFSEYQPVFEAALAAKLPILAGNLAQADARALAKQGLSAMPAERLQALRLDRPFPAALDAPLLDELRASHCGHLPENLLAPMALAQHARDAQMAKVLAAAGAKDGGVLIAGGGHVRRDHGVPYHLALELPGTSVASVSFREVRKGEVDPRAYVADEGPFDYVWFTPRHDDEDPCAAFK